MRRPNGTLLVQGPRNGPTRPPRRMIPGSALLPGGGHHCESARMFFPGDVAVRALQGHLAVRPRKAAAAPDGRVTGPQASDDRNRTLDPPQGIVSGSGGGGAPLVAL